MKTEDLTVVKQKLESALGSVLQSLDPDALDAALGMIQWKRIPTDIEDDDSMAKLLGLASLPPGSELVVITDASFVYGVGAFILVATEFGQFQLWYRDRFGERVFSGCDVIFWAPMDKRVWLVHHEGVYASVQLEA